MTSKNSTRKRANYLGIALLVLAGVSVVYICLGLANLKSSYSSATSEEIQATIRDSKCATRLLESANQRAQDIRVRDLDWVKERCVLVERQAAAFAGSSL